MGRGARRRWTTLVLLPASALAQTLTATNFVKYFDYEGSVAVAGMVAVTTDGTTQTLEWSLTGHESYCSLHVKGSEDNSCGIHIHSGTTCASDAGGHYYDEGTITDDPWATVAYGEYEPGTVGSHSGTASVDTGLSSSALEGRALILHNFDGERIACALLTAPPQTLVAMNFVPYFDYDGPLTKPAGTVTVTTNGTVQTLDWSLTGIDNLCSLHSIADDPEDNSCGIHVHSGTTCSGDAGGHYYSEGTITDDPWAIVSYGHYLPGTVGSHSGTASVDTGLLLYELAGHVLILHDGYGVRVACALLAAPPAPTAAPTPGPTPSPGNPTRRPTPKPTLRPTRQPTIRPTMRPTPQPTAITAGS